MWMTKKNQAILEVLRMAHQTGAPVPVAVEYVRAELRQSIRRQRARAREYRQKSIRDFARRQMYANMAASTDRIADRNVRMSQTIRRLQLEFASWRSNGPVALGPWQPDRCVRNVYKRLENMAA